MPSDFLFAKDSFGTLNKDSLHLNTKQDGYPAQIKEKRFARNRKLNKIKTKHIIAV
jgi:hypothetical protein